MRRIVLAVLLVLVVELGWVSQAMGQEGSCQKMTTSEGGGGIDDWIEICTDDYQSCNDENGAASKQCFQIEDECNKKECNHGLATLSFLPCEKCTERARPCYEAAKQAYDKCLNDHNRRGKTVSMVEFMSLDELIPQEEENRFVHGFGG